jgi:DoxX-like family
VFVTYVTVAIMASILTGIAAVSYLIGHPFPKAQLEMKRLPMSWMPRLGATLAAGSVGLLAGLAVPALGTLASLGLVLYFVGAFIAHARVGSRNLIGWAVFFITMVATFVLNLAHQGSW